MYRKESIAKNYASRGHLEGKMWQTRCAKPLLQPQILEGPGESISSAQASRSLFACFVNLKNLSKGPAGHGVDLVGPDGLPLRGRVVVSKDGLLLMDGGRPGMLTVQDLKEITVEFPDEKQTLGTILHATF
jgi:hypothetical protein